MKNYSVLIKAFCTVVVLGAESEEDAVERALEDVVMGDMQMDEAHCEREIPDGYALERASAHADVISEAE